jgi:Ser-tRNA(Ala) deacylase AlaX
MLNSEIRDDFLSPDCIQMVDKHVMNIISKDENNFSLSLKWDTTLHGVMNVPRSPVYVHHWSDKDLMQRVHDEVNDWVYEYGHEVSHSIIHIMVQDSTIAWHTDIADGRSGSVSIYLNRNYRVDFGGELLYNTDIKSHERLSNDEIERVTPQYNRAVFMEAGANHMVTPVFENVVRKSIQIWLKRKD